MSAPAPDEQVAAELAPQMMAIPGVVAFPSSPPPLGQGIRDKPIQMVIETSRPYAELQVMVDKMLDKAADNPGLVNVRYRSQAQRAAARS